MLRENTIRTRHISEVTREDNSIHVNTKDEAVEACEPRNTKFNGIQQKSSGIDNTVRVNTRNMGKTNMDRYPFLHIMSLVGQPGIPRMVGPSIQSVVNPSHV
uniref:Uncharacterized protein n=1 Tax=Glossina palpalis gambiensis TaxID=67801 RepID=A0A1B0BF11_9MUSC